MKKGLLFICSVVFLVLLTGCGGWTEEDAKNATQAYLDYFFKGDNENLAKYMNNTTEKELEEERKEGRETLIQSRFKESVPVTDALKTEYGDFYIELMSKSHYMVGEPVETEEGFEVPVQIEPIMSLSDGRFTFLDVQLNEELPDADLNERVYSSELKRMQKLMETPSYGEPEEVIMHITDSEDGYVFSDDDLSLIAEKACTIDRHWDSDRAEEAAEMLFKGAFEGKYAEMAEWTVASEKEIEGFFESIIGKEYAKVVIDESAAAFIKELGLPDTYSCPDSVAETFSDALRNILKGTKHEITGIECKEDEYIVSVRLTPYDTEKIGDELNARLSADAEFLPQIQEFIDREYELFAEILNEKVENEQYAEPVDFQFHMRFDDNKMYQPDMDEFFDIFNSFVPGA